MNGLRILIIEDEPLIAEDIRVSLLKHDYVVTAVAYDIAEALQQLKKDLPDLVLLDINLNGREEGIEIAKLIHQQYHIPFIFLTSYSDKSTLDKVKYTSPSGYIVKPFSDASLFSTIEISYSNFAQMQNNRHPELSLATLNKKLPDPISSREFELLKLIYAGSSNQHIADALYISMNTVKKHINNMYLKLDCHSRGSAIARLRELMQNT